MSHARDWATRIVHESTLHEANSFVTLTFSEEHFPWDASVSVRDVQLFCKRVRKRLGSFRFFACGEYGDQLSRPHYHIIMFGINFAGDRYLWRQTPAGYLTYRSPLLEELWPYGHSEIGELTTESAGYVCRYALKKIGGRQAIEHYLRPHPHTGEFHQVRREFICMSNKPGIGAGWWSKFSGDCFPSDFLIVDGNRVPIPRYYTKKLQALEEVKPQQHDQHFAVKVERKARARQHLDNNTPERLSIREEVQARRAGLLNRSMERPDET